MATATAQIAQHLSIAETAILEVQEWARVLWVRFTTGRPRFVSKKAVKVEHAETVETVMYCNPEALRGVRIGDTFRKDGAVYKVTQILSEQFVWEKDGVECSDRPRGYSEEKYKVRVVGAFFKALAK